MSPLFSGHTVCVVYDKAECMVKVSFSIVNIYMGTGTL